MLLQASAACSKCVQLGEDEGKMQGMTRAPLLYARLDMVLVVPTAHRMHTMPTTVGVARDMAGTRYGRGDRTRQSISQGGAWSGFRCHTRHLRETRAPVLVRVCACVFY
jgi:hypothetical protein